MSISINWLKIDEAVAAKAHPIMVCNNNHQLMTSPLDFDASIKPTTVVIMTRKLSLALVKSKISVRVNSKLSWVSLEFFEPEIDTTNNFISYKI